jgi:hypothetical protein
MTRQNDGENKLISSLLFPFRTSKSLYPFFRVTFPTLLFVRPSSSGSTAAAGNGSDFLSYSSSSKK